MIVLHKGGSLEVGLDIRSIDTAQESGAARDCVLDTK